MFGARRDSFAAAMPDDLQTMQQLLGDSRHNLPAVARPEDADEWKYLRPPSVSAPFTAPTDAHSIAMPDEATEREGRKVWIADKHDGFAEVSVVDENDEWCTVLTRRGDAVCVGVEEVQEANPANFDCCEDMASLTHLNEASVLHNLRRRYRLNLIHTYSGLFCITVNPWRWLPVYSAKIVMMYKGQTLNTMPPHIYAIADKVYNKMLEGENDQSILITGESGAGKTENTKKIIQYLTVVAATTYTAGSVTLEDQIVEANPIMEAFGNAKSCHNDNSSRFGKFIRVHFTPNGKVAGAECDSYLLEKSRLVGQAANERSFHIFYQLLSKSTSPEMKAELRLVGQSATDYRFIANGMDSVDSINDAQEMLHTEAAMQMLGISADEKMNVFRMVAAVLIMGNMKFRAISKHDDQAVCDGFIEPQFVADLLGFDDMEFLRAITEPTVLICGEEVKQGRNVSQVMFSTAALAKGIYEKLFRWLVKRCNTSLNSQAHERGGKANFIGLLDIAGFEIFAINSFEQLMINFTNEKLQQYFNHHMFISEQQEYRMEGLKWEYIDFAADLKPQIDLLEKPLGILPLLEEECMVPNGSDLAFCDKLEQKFLGKSAVFNKPKYAKGAARHMAHFSIVHYAGVVNYNVDGWLDKNKDPLNECAVQIFQNCKNKLMRDIWNYYGTTGFHNYTGGAPQKRQSLSFLTISTIYRQQLNNLLAVLNSTDPHFVRCIVPNYERKAGKIDAPLVLNQLRCNGVLEGIRICRRGYPNRLLYEHFVDRYRLLSAELADWGDAPETAAAAICESVGLAMDTDYAMGLTKIFCACGVIGDLELRRSARLAEVVLQLQAHIRSFLAEKRYLATTRLQQPTIIVQENVRLWVELLDWPWFRLLLNLQPIVRGKVRDHNRAIELLEDEKQKNAEELDRMRKLIEELSEVVDRVNAIETADIGTEMGGGKAAAANREDGDVADMSELELVQLAIDQRNEMTDLAAKVTDRERDIDLMEKSLKEKEELLARAAAEAEKSAEKQGNAEKELQKYSQNLYVLQDMLSRIDKVLSAEGDGDPRKRSRRDLQIEEQAKTIDQLRSLAKSLYEKAIERYDENIQLNNRISDEAENRSQVVEMNKNNQDRIAELEELLRRQKNTQELYRTSTSKLRDELQDSEDKMKSLQDQLRREVERNRKKDQEVVSMQKRLHDQARQELTVASIHRRHSSTVRELQDQLDNMQKQQETRSGEVQQLQARVREQKMETARLHDLISELRETIKQHECSLNHEKFERKRFEQATKDLSADLDTLRERLARTEQRLVEEQQENEKKNQEMNRMHDQMQRTAVLQEKTLADLRDRHSDTVAQLQDRIEKLHRRALKYESENQRLKAEIFAQTEEPRRMSRSLSRSQLQEQLHALSRSQSFSVDAASEIEQLQREREALLGEKRLMRAEIEQQLRVIQQESDNRSTLDQQLRAARVGMSRLQERLSSEEDDRADLSRQLRQMRLDVSRQRTGSHEHADIEREYQRIRLLVAGEAPHLEEMRGDAREVRHRMRQSARASADGDASDSASTELPVRSPPVCSAATVAVQPATGDSVDSMSDD